MPYPNHVLPHPVAHHAAAASYGEHDHREMPNAPHYGQGAGYGAAIEALQAPYQPDPTYARPGGTPVKSASPADAASSHAAGALSSGPAGTVPPSLTLPPPSASTTTRSLSISTAVDVAGAPPYAEQQAGHPSESHHPPPLENHHGVPVSGHEGLPPSHMGSHTASPVSAGPRDPYYGYVNVTTTYPPRRKPIRAAQACDACRQRKAKCDEGRPLCGFCKEAMIPCVYREVPPPK